VNVIYECLNRKYNFVPEEFVQNHNKTQAVYILRITAAETNFGEVFQDLASDINMHVELVGYEITTYIIIVK